MAKPAETYFLNFKWDTTFLLWKCPLKWTNNNYYDSLQYILMFSLTLFFRAWRQGQNQLKLPRWSWPKRRANEQWLSLKLDRLYQILAHNFSLLVLNSTYFHWFFDLLFFFWLSAISFNIFLHTSFWPGLVEPFSDSSLK